MSNNRPTSGSSGRRPSCHGACRGKPRATSVSPLSHTVGRGNRVHIAQGGEGYLG
jgi:hypothetical protein